MDCMYACSCVLQAQKDKREQLLFQIEDLKREHTQLSEVISKANNRIMTVTDEVRVVMFWSTEQSMQSKIQHNTNSLA
jgi:hypothetical protein